MILVGILCRLRRRDVCAALVVEVLRHAGHLDLWCVVEEARLRRMLYENDQIWIQCRLHGSRVLLF